jgi:uncharacterized protein
VKKGFYRTHDNEGFMSQQNSAGHHEEGVEVPYEQIDADALRNMIEEFVTRDGADWGEVGCTLEGKVEQVLRQLGNRKVKVVFDLKSQTANIVVCLLRNVFEIIINAFWCLVALIAGRCGACDRLPSAGSSASLRNSPGKSSTVYV